MWEVTRCTKDKDDDTCFFKDQDKIRVWLSISSWMTYLFSFCSLFLNVSPQFSLRQDFNEKSLIITEVFWMTPRLPPQKWIVTAGGLRELKNYFNVACGTCGYMGHLLSIEEKGCFWVVLKQSQRQEKAARLKYSGDHWG